jgi:hypothetical protein
VLEAGPTCRLLQQLVLLTRCRVCHLPHAHLWHHSKQQQLQAAAVVDVTRRHRPVTQHQRHPQRHQVTQQQRAGVVAAHGQQPLGQPLTQVTQGVAGQGGSHTQPGARQDQRQILQHRQQDLLLC